MTKLISKCPACSEALIISTLKCPCCGMELKNDFEFSPFDKLDSEKYELLISFLRNRGNLSEVQNDLNISYPTVKKKLDELLTALNLSNSSKTDEKKEREVIDLKVDYSSNKASEIIKAKLKEHGGHITVYTLTGRPCEVYAQTDGKTFASNKLPRDFEYTLFDVIVDLLLEHGGSALKGNGRNYKFGYPGCEENTVVGAIAKSQGAKYGESVLDPVFVLAAVLDWAGIAENGRGELRLKREYKRLL